MRHAVSAPAGTHRRNRGSRTRRWRSAPRPPPAGGSCPPTQRPRAASAPRRPSGCTPCETASPDTRPCGPGHGGPEGSLRGRARSPATSPRRPPGRASGRIADPAVSRRSTVTWCRSAVNRASLSLRATWRTRSSSLDTPCPALRPGRDSLAAFPSARPLSSTASAAASTALFGGLQVLRACLTSRGRASRAYRRSVPLTARHPPICHPANHKGRGITDRHGRPRDLPVLEHGNFCACQVLRPRGVPRRLAITPPAMLPSACFDGVGTPEPLFRGSIAQPAQPLPTLRRRPRESRRTA